LQRIFIPADRAYSVPHADKPRLANPRRKRAFKVGGEIEGWDGGGWRGGGWGWGFAPGLALGLGLGAAPFYAYGGPYYGAYAYGDCVMRRRAVINRWGHRVWRWVRACY
jgi:hypothetical protein